MKGTAPFYRRIQGLFFAPGSHESWKSIGGNGLHIRRVYDSPHIYEIDNFLSDTELQYFEEFIKTCPFQRSFVDNMQFDNTSTTSDMQEKTPKRQRRTILDSNHRTSTFYAFKHRADNTIRAIEQRTADLLGCWVQQIEGLQLVRYLPGQFFGVHHDLGDLGDDDMVILPRKNLLVKRRLVTLFVYLNDLESEHGGCTYFPKCDNLRVKPKKGTAVLWSNINSSGQPDPNTIHAGETVHSTNNEEVVVKYGLNIWITEE